MTVVKKIDDLGRIAIPKDVRRSLRWMGGDEIEIITNTNNTLLLRKHEDDATERLRELQAEWKDDTEVAQQFLELIALIESKKE